MPTATGGCDRDGGCRPPMPTAATGSVTAKPPTPLPPRPLPGASSARPPRPRRRLQDSWTHGVRRRERWCVPRMPGRPGPLCGGRRVGICRGEPRGQRVDRRSSTPHCKQCDLLGAGRRRHVPRVPRHGWSRDKRHRRRRRLGAEPAVPQPARLPLRGLLRAREPGRRRRARLHRLCRRSWPARNGSRREAFRGETHRLSIRRSPRRCLAVARRGAHVGESRPATGGSTVSRSAIDSLLACGQDLSTSAASGAICPWR